MNTVEVLKAARAKIEKPENWTRGKYAANEYDRRVEATDPAACKFCALGAMFSTLNSDYVGRDNSAFDSLYLAANETGRSVVLINDWASHEEVLAMFDRAIVIEEAKVSLSSSTDEIEA